VKRSQAGIALALTIALGILSRRMPLGIVLWDKSLGDVLYTVMVYWILVLLRPTADPRRLVPSSIAISFAIELFQLTGIPLRLPRLLQIPLGTTFAWHDMACYVVGGLLAGAAHLAVRARAR